MISLILPEQSSLSYFRIFFQAIGNRYQKSDFMICREASQVSLCQILARLVVHGPLNVSWRIHSEKMTFLNFQPNHRKSRVCCMLSTCISSLIMFIQNLSQIGSVVFSLGNIDFFDTPLFANFFLSLQGLNQNSALTSLKPEA